MVLTYVLIKLYDRPCVFLVRAWKPFKWLFQKYYKKLNVRTSIVEVFATFVFLSSVKIIAVSTTLLTWTRVHDEFGGPLEDRYSILIAALNILDQNTFHLESLQF